MDKSKVIVCDCASYGSTGFHKDNRETVILVEGKLYELTLSTRTFEELLELPSNEVPHVRHLNHIPNRSTAKQKIHSDSSAFKVLEAAKEVAKEKREEYTAKRVKTTTSSTDGGDSMAKNGKIKQVIEALHKKALTVEDITALGVSKSTAATLKYFLKRKGFTLEESQVSGKVAIKIVKAPEAALAAV